MEENNGKCENKKIVWVNPIERFDQNAPKDASELVELFSLDHALHSTKAFSVHGSKHDCYKQFEYEYGY